MIEDNFIPDFSGDDFANDAQMQKRRAAIKAHENMIENAMAIIRQELEVEDACHINLKGFQMFKTLTAIVTHSMKSTVSTGALRIAMAKYFSSYPVPRFLNAGTDQYFFGYLKLRNSYPKTYIHKETLREKVTDIFLKRDIDFPHSRKFSQQFQVLTEDPPKLEVLLFGKALDTLADFREMELEFSNNALLFRCSRKPVSIEEAIRFSKLAKTLRTVFE